MNMKFLIITHVKHKKQNDKYFAYAPYVREMNIWLKYVDEIEIVSPLTNDAITKIDIAYNHNSIKLSSIPSIEFTSASKIFKSAIRLPKILLKLYKACVRADHIHLRCPGNIGLLGCFIQICFPNKIKTAKYAGNWDPKSKQPLSYKIQKYILSNTFFSKNMLALVYGKWNNQSKNIKPFFTASYHENEIEEIIVRNYNDVLNFIFVGTLVQGKRPQLTIQIVEALNKKGIKCRLDLYGDGVLRSALQMYIEKNKLKQEIKIHGNISKEGLKTALKSADFLILSSKSEGWPKVVAEAMFYGVVPITTNISCLSWMLDEGRRGILIEEDLDKAINKIKFSIKNDNLLAMSIASQQWSQKYTLEKFESEIKKLLIRT